jgi:hypothetical protein
MTEKCDKCGSVLVIETDDKEFAEKEKAKFRKLHDKCKVREHEKN